MQASFWLPYGTTFSYFRVCCPMNGNQDGHQNGPNMSAVKCTCGHSQSLNMGLCPMNDNQNGHHPSVLTRQISYMDYFIKHTPNFEYGFCPVACQFARVDTLTISHFILVVTITILNVHYCPSSL